MKGIWDAKKTFLSSILQQVLNILLSTRMIVIIIIFYKRQSIKALNEAARILAVYPSPSISHQVAFRPLTNELVKRGHEVVVITTDPQYSKGGAPANLTEIDLHDVSYKPWNERVINSHIDGGKTSLFDIGEAFLKIMVEIGEIQLQVDEIKDIIKNQNDTFDLLITEAWVKWTLGFSHVIKAPVIQFSSMGPIFDNLDAIGSAYHPILYPQGLLLKVHGLSLWERLDQYYHEYRFRRLSYESELRENVFLKKVFGPDTPPLSELKNNVDMMFLTVHPIWEGNRPVPPGLIYTPGMHQNKQKDLPKELKSYLDSSVHGVIYISFGTNVNPSSLDPKKVQNIIKALSRLPYDVLWKWNADVLPGRNKNIKISKWFPQSDLLRHPKIKLFITQGGLQSTEESLTAGVPLIGIPMFADQFFNTENYVKHKIGLKVIMKDIEVEPFRNDIKKVIEDKSYRENVIRLRTIMNDQPMSSLERAVWWTEHVLRHGGARHLRTPIANMPWTKYYDLELILLVLSGSVILFSLFMFFSVRYVLKRLSLSIKTKKSKVC